MLLSFKVLSQKVLIQCWALNPDFVQFANLAVIDAHLTSQDLFMIIFQIHFQFLNFHYLFMMLIHYFKYFPNLDFILKVIQQLTLILNDLLGLFMMATQLLILSLKEFHNDFSFGLLFWMSNHDGSLTLNDHQPLFMMVIPKLTLTLMVVPII